MTQEKVQNLLREREDKLREECPEAFSHPGIQEGEILLSVQLIGVAEINASLYRNQGLLSARCGEMEKIRIKVVRSTPGGRVEEMVEMPGRPIFANVQEMIALEMAHE